MADTDVNDEAIFELHTQTIEAGVAQARANLGKQRATGKCLFCDDPTDLPEQQFCDAYCREFHRRETHNKLQRGR